MDGQFFSPLESRNPTQQQFEGGLAFGRITKVYPSERLCEVKTFMGTGSLNDNHIPKCQWLSLDSSMEGDEFSSIPRINSVGIVLHVSGVPFIFGFFTPLDENGSAATNKEVLNEGDRIISTRFGNKIITRSGGEIQIHCTETNRTIHLPNRDMINTLCRNYEFRTDGGTIDWVNLGNDDTYCKHEYRDNFKRTNVLIEEKGKVPGDLISYTRIGPGTRGGIDAPIWQRTIAVDGSTRINVNNKTYITVLATGETTLDIGPGQATLNIKPDGTTSFTTQSTITATAKADVYVNTDASVNVKAGGPANITCGGSATIKTGGATSIDSGGPISLKAKGNKIIGGVVTDHMVNNDPITGIPLQPVGAITAS